MLSLFFLGGVALGYSLGLVLGRSTPSHGDWVRRRKDFRVISGGRDQ